MSKRKLRKELKQKKKLQDCARTFGIVGDLTRLQICWLLCNHPELSVGEIAELLDKDPSLVSHALRKLREAGVVSGRREEKYIFYSLEQSTLGSFIKQSLS